MRQQYMSGENERGQRIYSPFYDENFTYPQDSLPSLFEQKLLSKKFLLKKKYRAYRLFSLILLFILTLLLGLLMLISNIYFNLLLITLLAILYSCALKLYLTIKVN
jgi:hypothetical protein